MGTNRTVARGGAGVTHQHDTFVCVDRPRARIEHVKSQCLCALMYAGTIAAIGVGSPVAYRLLVLASRLGA